MEMEQAVRTFLRRTVAESPRFGNQWEVINIEDIGDHTMVFDLNNGQTIRLDVTVYPTDPMDTVRALR
jgi:hypothetical protein